MPTQLNVTAALDSALRKAFSEASARPKPETKMSDVVEALAGMGVTAEMVDGCLCVRQDTTQLNPALALKGFAARPEFAKYFVTAADDPRNWSTKMKMDFIVANGPDAWGRKANSKPLEPTVKVLDVNMSKADYLNLTRAEKVQFLSEFGDLAASRILGKNH